MATQMLNYIEEQPLVWRKILADRVALTAPLAAIACGRAIERILLVGTGSSGNAALAAKPFFEKLLGREVTVLASTRLDTVLPPANATLVFVISQSGRSTSTLEAEKHLRQAGFPVVAMTADPASPAAQTADAHMLIACGEETVGPKTKGFTATVLTLYIAALALAETCHTADPTVSADCETALRRSFDAAEENLTRSRAFCERHMTQLAIQPHFTLIADGAGLAAAAEGALKLLETLYVPAFAYEFEEYLHGVNNTISEVQCNFLLISGKENAERMLRLDRFCREQHCPEFVVSTQPLPDNRQPHMLSLLGSGEAYTQIFETLLFFQLLSALGSEHKGIDVDKPKYDGFYTDMGTKL